MGKAIKVEDLSKQYRLGVVGTGTLSHDLNRFWHKIRGKDDPYLKVGETNDRSTVGKSDYVWALKDINFEVGQGEVVGIIGKNGAGKSTLLKLLSRVTTPTTGRINIRGRIASLLEVGTGFHPELTGRENIFLNGAILGMTKAEIRSKLDEIIDFSGTARYIDTPVKRYSSGMRVRLAFAVAAHLEPEILIVDEVLAVGDAEFQKKAIGKMQDVARGGGRTVLFVSHNLAAVENLCQRGIVLVNGSISYDGSATDAVEYYSLVSSQAEGGGTKVNPELLSKCKTNSFQVKKILLNSGKSSVVSGEPLTVTIIYKSFERYIAPGFTFKFKDFNGKEVFRLSNMPISGFQIQSLYSEGSLILTLPKLPLVKGTYFVDFGFARERMEWHFFVENLITLDVLGKDVYQSGLELDNSRGLIWVNHLWEHSEI